MTLNRLLMRAINAKNIDQGEPEFAGYLTCPNLPSEALDLPGTKDSGTKYHITRSGNRLMFISTKCLLPIAPCVVSRSPSGSRPLLGGARVSTA